MLFTVVAGGVVFLAACNGKGPSAPTPVGSGYTGLAYLAGEGSLKGLATKAGADHSLVRYWLKKNYAGELSLAEALQPEWISIYGQRATGTKYLINPNKGMT